MSDDICVVVRSVGERTEEACINIAQTQLLSGDQITVVKGKPFPEAHIESIQLAMDSKARWALFLDADILLKEDAINSMVSEAQKVPIPFFQLNFRILDYGFKGESYGVHFYSATHFEKALRYRDNALIAQRPEYQVCFEMATQERIPSISSDIVVALHGFEQYYADLYRTTFVRSVKYKRHLDYFFQSYAQGYFEDHNINIDDRLLFWGLVDGMIYGYENEKAPLISSFYNERVDKVLTGIGAQEKRNFILKPGFVEDTFARYKATPLYISNIEWICPSNFYTVKVPDRSLKSRIWKGIQPILSRVKRSIKTLFFG